MAWLKLVADKAEDFLNQIDQNAAVAFQYEKDKGSNLKDEALSEVTWESPTPVRKSSPKSQKEDTRNSNQFAAHAVKPASNLPSPLRGVKKQDDDLITFLNSSEPIESPAMPKQPISAPEVQRPSVGRVSSPLPPDTVVIMDEKGHSSHSGSSASSSKRSSPYSFFPSQTSATQVSSPPAHPTSGRDAEHNNLSIMGAYEETKVENTLLQNEVRSLNGEISQLLHRAKAAEKSCSSLKEQLGHLEEKERMVALLQEELNVMKQRAAANEELIFTLQAEKDRLEQSSSDITDGPGKEVEAVKEELRITKEMHTQEIGQWKKRCSSMEEDWQTSVNQVSELQQELTICKEKIEKLEQLCDRHRKESKEAHDELEQYRSRAQRILQEKERLIVELRGPNNNMLDDSLSEEVQKLRQERELLREETLQLSTRLQAARDEFLEEEKKFETFFEQAAVTKRQLEESLQEERKRRQAAEEDSKIHAEELRSIRDELSRQRTILASRVKDREMELTRLRAQLTQRPTSVTDDELEQRLHSLTHTLVQKQTNLETITTERNALRLQLEKIENKYRQAVSQLQKHQSNDVHVNDTDDVKAQIPSAFVERPSDSGISRRMKRAYSSLDSVGMRMVVFLRRYPVARNLLVCYLVLAHLWMILILFSNSPQPEKQPGIPLEEK